MTIGDDPSEDVAQSLLHALAPLTVRAYRVDALRSQPGSDIPDGPVVADCATEELTARVAADGPADVICLSGRPTWHSVRAAVAALERLEPRGGTRSTLMVQGPPPSVSAEAQTHNADDYDMDRAETIKRGLRLGILAAAARHVGDATVVSCGAGRGVWAAIPAERAATLQSWLAPRAALLEALDATHRERAEYVARTSELFDLLERSQRNAVAVVRSTRFRVGTRVARLLQRVRRREQFFAAPSRILRRQATVDTLRAQYGPSNRLTVAVPRDALRVTYVLPDLRRSGGGLAVMQLANDLRLLGVDAKIATWRVRGEAARARLLAPPLQFDSEAALVRDLPAADVVVATHWSSAPLARQVLDRGGAARAAYLIQDYEAWFYPESDTTTRARVLGTYGMISNRIATSAWLQELLQRDGYPSTKIPSGVDLEIYYPRTEPALRPMVLGMARPRTPRRGFQTLVDALAQVHEAMPQAEIVLFGEAIRGMNLPFPFRGTGVISNPDRLAQLYSRARVFVDTSDFQAFGRAAIEAMACGAVPVLTNVGGMHEYAIDAKNAFLVEPRDPVATAQAVLRVITDDELHRDLRREGLATVCRHSAHRDAVTTLALFERIVAENA